MKKITTLIALHVSFTICFCLCFFLTWRELQALLPNLYIFPKSDLPKLVFSLSTCAAYTQTFTVLVHMIISCKYTTRLIKCTMFLLIIMIIIIILQRSGDWTIPFPWCCWYVLEKLCSLVLRFWKSLSSCFCWTTVLWNALKAIKFIIDFIFHSLLNSILYLVLNKPVQNLQQLFADMPVSEVENALEAVNGDINEAAGVILNQSVRGL